MVLFRYTFPRSMQFQLTVYFVIAPLSTAGAVPFHLQRTYAGEHLRDQFGYAAHAAGDVTGDGFDDFLVGANVSDAAAPGGGSVSFFAGGAEVAVSPLHVVAGSVPNENCGAAIGGGGDLNGDGYDDWVAGAPGLGASGDAAGRVYVFFGGPAFDFVPDRIIDGVVAGGQFGAAVLVGCDLDGDGEGDLVIGAPRAGNGEIHIYRGGTSFLEAGAARVVHARAGDNRFGKSLARLADIDGNGCEELLVGSPRSSQAATWAGAVILYRGTAALDTIPDLVFLGENAGDEFGTSLAADADLDGDGRDDILVGAPLANLSGSTDAGRAYLFSGGSELDEIIDLRFDGNGAGSRFGSAVTSGFDWDGDGRADVAIGAPGADTGGTDAGSGAIFFGGAGMDPLVDVTIQGPVVSAQLGSSAASLGDIRRNGRGALLLGGYGANDNGRALLYASDDNPVDAARVEPVFGARLLPAWPNPSPSGVQIVLETLVPGHWRVDVFDARGRHVAYVFAGFLAPGAQGLAWNGRGSNGMQASSGVYSIRATSKTHTVTTRVIVVH